MSSANPSFESLDRRLRDAQRTLASIRSGGADSAGEWDAIDTLVQEAETSLRAARTELDESFRIRTQELIAINDSLHHALEGAELGLWDWDATTGRVNRNERWAQFLGYTLDEVEPTVEFWKQTIHPREAERIISQWQNHLDGHTPACELEYRARHKSGRYIWMLVRGRVIQRDEQGRPLRACGTTRDITDRKKAEAAAQLRADALENGLNGFDIVDAGGRFIYANRTYLDMWGYDTLDEILGTSPAGHCDDPTIPEKIIAKLKQDGEGIFEFKARRKDGSTFDVLMSTKLYHDAMGRELYIGDSLDITERKQVEEERSRLEDQLRQAQKMEAIGQLAGGIAHDFNNALTSIIGNIDLAESILRRGGQNKRLAERLKDIQTSALWAADLTSQLLAFSRRQVRSPQPLNLNDVIVRLKRMLRRLISESVSIEYELASRLRNVMVDPSQIEQVIVNLVVNAQDAMPQGGKLTLRTRTTSIAPRSRKAALQLDPGTYVKLSVIDTGVGLDGATKHRVFEPFFTTKSIGKGTGLGLATVYGIVKQALGEVTVDSKPGEGATFTVYLPATEQAALPHVGESRSDRLPVGSETLLLCEDDKLVRRLAQRMLLTAGYNVLVASNGAEALELAEKHSDRIHMLVTDIVMPDMNGRQVADALTKRFTDLKVLYVSGYTSNVIAHHGVLEDGVELLSKPFTYHGLLTRVRAILDR